MNLMNYFIKPKVRSVEYYLLNQDCKELVERFKELHLPDTTRIIIAFENEKQETNWDICSNMEPAQAILTLDQLHHRIQHEGLPGQ